MSYVTLYIFVHFRYRLVALEMLQPEIKRNCPEDLKFGGTKKVGKNFSPVLCFLTPTPSSLHFLFDMGLNLQTAFFEYNHLFIEEKNGLL